MADYEFDDSGMPVGFQPAAPTAPADQLQFDESGLPVGFQPPQVPKADPLTDRYKLQTDIAAGSTADAGSYEKARAAYAAGELAKFDAEIGAQHGGATVFGDDAMRPGDLIDATPHDKLMASDRYRQVYSAALPVLGEDKAQAYAKDTIANDAHSIPYLRDSIFSDLLAAPKNTAFEYHYGAAPDVPKPDDSASGMTYVEGDPGLAQQPALDQFGNAPAIAGSNIESAAWKYGAKGPLLIGAAGGMAVDAVRSLFGNDTTAAQDFFFQRIKPIDDWIARIEAEKPKASGTGEQIVDKVSGMFVPLVMAAATRNPEILEANGAELFSMPVWQAAWNSAASAIRQGLLPAETMALPGAIDAAQQVAEKGGGTAESVVASLNELAKGTAQFSAPMAAGGSVLAKAATGGAAMAAIGTAGRLAAGQPTGFSDIASDTIIGAFMGQMHQDPESIPAAVRPKAEEAVAAAGDDPAAKARVAYVMDELQNGKPPLWAAAEFNVIMKTGQARDEGAFQQWNDQRAAQQVTETPAAEMATPEARATTQAAQELVGEPQAGTAEPPIWPDFQQRLEASRARAAAPEAEATPAEAPETAISVNPLDYAKEAPAEQPAEMPPAAKETTPAAEATQPLALTAEEPPAEEPPKGQPTGKMYAQGKRVQAIQLDDGTWMVRQRVAGNWQAWEPRETFDASGAFGYRPFQPPSGQVNLPGGRVKVGEPRAKEPKPEPGPTTALEALARGGGLSREAWKREGIDPEEFSHRYGTKWLFRVEGGMTPDKARESLQESGYLPRDPENAPPTVTHNDAIDVVMRGLAGDHTYSIDDAAAHDKMLQERFENLMAHEAPDVADEDFPVAHEVVKAAEQAHDAGVPWHEMEPHEGESDEDYMARVHRAIAEQEAQHGADNGPEAENRVEGVPGQPEFRLAAQEAPAERPAEPRAQQGGLFGAPTGREVTAAAARARDLELRGGDRAAVPMRAGEGELFAGPRPEQAEIPQHAETEIPFDLTQGKPVPRAERGTEHQKAIHAAIGEIYGKLGKNAPRVTVLRSPNGLAKEIQDRLDKGRGTAWRQYARGLITNTGHVFLFSNNIESVGRGVRTFVHETIGHHGVENIIDQHVPGGWNRMSDEIWRMRTNDKEGSPEFRSVIDDVTKRYPKASSVTFAKEVIAVAAERGIRNGPMARVISAVRAFVRKYFPSLKFSEHDIVQLLTHSENFLREGSKHEGELVGEHQYALDTAENVAPHSDENGDGEPQKTIRTPIGTLHVETKAGEERRGPGWTRVMRHDYGYIEGVPGRDGGSMDTIIGEGARDPSRPVFVIDQKSATGGFDEHKVLVGFKNQRDAERAYLSEYPRGWDRMGQVHQFSAAEFRDWARTTGREEAQVGKIHPDVPRVSLRAQQPDAVAMHAVTSRGMPTRANHEGQPLERLGLPNSSRALTMRTSFRDAQAGGEGTHGAVLRNLYDVNTDGRQLFDRARENLESKGLPLDEPHMANEFERLVVAGGFDGYRTADGRAVVLGAKVPLAEHIHGRTIPEGAAQPGIGRNAAPAAQTAGRNVSRNAPSEREDQTGARQAESNKVAGEGAEQRPGVRVPGRAPGPSAREGLDEDRSIRNAATEAVRAARGAEPVEKIGGRTANEVEVDAHVALAKNPNLGREIAHEVANTPRNISDTEAAVLAIDRQRIAQEHDAARERVTAAMDAKDEIGEAQARAAMKLAEDARELNEKATTHAGTEWSNSGRARLLSVQKDESLVSLLTDFKIRAGRDPTPAERGNIERIADEIKEAKSDVKSPGRKKVPKDTAAAARDEFAKLVEAYHKIPKDELMTKECFL